MRTRDRVLVFLLLGVGATLSSTIIASRVSVAFVVVGVLVPVIYFLVLTRNELKLTPGLRYLALFLGWALVDGIYLGSYSRLPFSGAEFAKAFLELVFYSGTALILTAYLRRAEMREIPAVALSVLTLHACIALYIYFALRQGGALPYDFFWWGQEGTSGTSYYMGSQFIRARGAFSEPSVLGIYLALGLGIVLFKSPGRLRLPLWKLGIVAGAALLSFALSGYALLCVLVLLFFFRLIRGRGKGAVVRVVVVLGLLVAAVLAVPALRNTFQETIDQRLASVFEKTDYSAVARVFATWELPTEITKVSPIGGAGLGNLRTVFPSLGARLRYFALLLEGPGGWNTLAYVLGTTGLVGSVLFGLFLWNMIKEAPAGGLLFLAAMFTNARFLDPMFWIFYAFLSLPEVGVGGRLAEKRRVAVVHRPVPAPIRQVRV